jgi:hypothetical protein
VVSAQDLDETPRESQFRFFLRIFGIFASIVLTRDHPEILQSESVGSEEDQNREGSFFPFKI